MHMKASYRHCEDGRHWN